MFSLRYHSDPNVVRYFYITQAFQDSTGSISNLAGGITAMQTDCKDTTLLGSFSYVYTTSLFDPLPPY